MGAARTSGYVLGKTNRGLRTTRLVMTIGVCHSHQFDVTARFRFTHEQTLETTLQADQLSSTLQQPR